ncbi:hypothetical protein AX16_003311 [Volvariella volvacea WC 439]|nr:hypothetical protein AX16_003311 [Volvariella volvacea WC 439]
MDAASHVEPRLPQDLERIIFELAAHERSGISVLMQVARRVHAWLQPMRYEVVIFPLKQSNPPKDTNSLFYFGVSQRPDDAQTRHVRHVLIQGENHQDLEISLQKYHNVQDLALWNGIPPKSFSLISSIIRSPDRTVSTRGLLRLSVSLTEWFPNNDVDFNHEIMKDLTHLDALGDPVEWKQGNNFACLKNLRYLMFSDAYRGLGEDIRKCLEECEALEIVVVYQLDNFRSEDSQSGLIEELPKLRRKVGPDGIVEELPEDRVVVFPYEETQYGHFSWLDDWVRGALGGDDLWSRAERIVGGRRGTRQATGCTARKRHPIHRQLVKTMTVLGSATPDRCKRAPDPHSPHPILKDSFDALSLCVSHTNGTGFPRTPSLSSRDIVIWQLSTGAAPFGFPLLFSAQAVSATLDMSSLKASRYSNYSPMRFLVAAQMILLGSLALYGFAVLLVMTPFIQTHVLFAHRLKLWGYSKFDHPEYYGLSPGKTVNVQFPSLDNTTLGGWFIFSDFYHQTLPFPPSTRDLTSHISKALTNGRPTILFMHGNTGTRALNLRIPLYTAYTSKFDANVFVIDYRGFGDSQGHPTVQGVSMDAKAAWDFLIARGARAQDILIVGHSLGTAISGILAAQLGREGVQPKGVVLMSPFSSVRAVIDTYALFGILPLLKPLAAVPLAPRVLTWSLKHKFDTLTLVPVSYWALNVLG